MAREPTRRIPVFAVLRDAVVLPFRHSAELSRAAGVPMLALIAVTLSWELLPWRGDWFGMWSSYLVSTAALGWVATTVHRLVLLDEASASQHFTRSSWQRVAIYFVAFAFLCIVFYIGKFLLFNAVGIATGITYVKVGEQPNATARLWLDWGASVIALLFVARFALVLPSIAVGAGHEIREAWRLSRGNGWQLAAVFGLFPWALSWLNRLLFRDGASSLEYTLFLVFGCLLAVLEATALSLAFAALTAPAPRPTDPPA